MKNLLLDNVAAINEVRRTAEALKKLKARKLKAKGEEALKAIDKR